MALRKTEVQELEPLVYSRDQHSISRNSIDPDALKILYRLVRNGFKAYLVGGGVRDILLGKKPKDFDIATDATPRKIKSLFRNSRIIGRRFKLVHIYFQGNKIIEVSTFRDSSAPLEGDEGSEEGVKPLLQDNQYGDERTDAVRRDLTINGLFYDIASFSIIDYVGGMQDLNDGIIRVIGDPDVRFAEDPVRLLRVVRHSAKSGFQIEKRCLASLIENRHLIRTSSAVRVYEEMKKDLCSGYLLPILSLLGETKLLEFLLPVLAENDVELLAPNSPLWRALAHLDEYTYSGEQITPTVVLAILALFVPTTHASSDEIPIRFSNEEEIKEHVKSLFLDLTVPRKERERVEALLAAWMRLFEDDGDKKRLGMILKSAEQVDLINLYRCVIGDKDGDRFLRLLRSDTHKRHARPMQRRRGGRRRG